MTNNERLKEVKDKIISAVNICKDAGWKIRYCASHVIINEEMVQERGACPLLCVALVYNNFKEGEKLSYRHAANILGISNLEFFDLDVGLADMAVNSSPKNLSFSEFRLLGREIANQIDLELGEIRE